VELTNRQRFVRLFKGQRVDRVPFYQFMGAWKSSIERWKTEGLRVDVTRSTLWQTMGFDGFRGYFLPVKTFVWPEFETEVLEAVDDVLTVRGRWGGTLRTHKNADLLPLTTSGAVSDWRSWEQMKERLDADTPGRLPENWEEVCAEARNSDEPVYAGDLPTGFFGGPRYLLGLECQAMLFYDDPALMHDILDTLCDLWITLFARVQRDIEIDYFFIWEDMCFKGGPLISPALFREFLLPRYKRLTGALKEVGVKLIFVDSDGDIRKLIPLWMEGGVDITFPWESQFELDLLEPRRQYPELGMIGGVDKHAFIAGRAGVDRALEPIPALLESGRFIPAVDHEVPHDVSWDTYRYFCERLRDMVWNHPPRTP
jgi:uroporphyrinogen decarboxylase